MKLSYSFRKSITKILLACLITSFPLLYTGCLGRTKTNNATEDGGRKNRSWQLVWEDNFDGTQFDPANWSKIPRGRADWQNLMSDNDDCYDVKGGNLILRGIHNPDTSTDTVAYLTGGVYTKNKRAFHGGRVEVRAKLFGATGAWPAIWMLPFEEEKYPWPGGGEIDIMERLNYDSIAHQTVHSAYIDIHNQRDYPPQAATGPIDPGDYNTYSVELYPDSLVFFINENYTFTYPRIETEVEGQWPFDKPFYLLIDMQLGGSWVGEVDGDDVPVEMWVDWVRYYN